MKKVFVKNSFGTSWTPSPTNFTRDVEDAVPYEITRGVCDGTENGFPRQ